MKLALSLALAATAMVCSTPVKATDFSYQGRFFNDDNAQLFNFSIAQASTVTLRSYSYAGGNTAAGRTITAGGFDLILSLFDLTTGSLVAQQDDSSSAPTDPVTGARFDVWLASALAPGTYAVYVSQYDNFAGSSLGEFRYAGQPGFTARYCAGADPVSGGQGLFCDITGTQRTGNWAFDVLGADTARDGGTVGTPAVPEPATWMTMIAGFASIGAALRRRAHRVRAA